MAEAIASYHMAMVHAGRIASGRRKLMLLLLFATMLYASLTWWIASWNLAEAPEPILCFAEGLSDQQMALATARAKEAHRQEAWENARPSLMISGSLAAASLASLCIVAFGWRPRR